MSEINPTPATSEPSKHITCPECNALQRRYKEVQASHKPECSHVTLDDMKVHFREAEKERLKFLGKYWTEVLTVSQRWEGKFHIVKHENNQLRRKLYPQGRKVYSPNLKAFGEDVDACLKALGPDKLRALFESVGVKFIDPCIARFGTRPTQEAAPEIPELKTS